MHRIGMVLRAAAIVPQVSCSSADSAGTGPITTDATSEPAPADGGGTEAETDGNDDVGPIAVGMPCADPIDAVYGDPGPLGARHTAKLFRSAILVAGGRRLCGDRA